MQRKSYAVQVYFCCQRLLERIENQRYLSFVLRTADMKRSHRSLRSKISLERQSMRGSGVDSAQVTPNVLLPIEAFQLCSLTKERWVNLRKL